MPSREQTPETESNGGWLQPARDGLMWLNGRFRARLERAGLSCFDAVMKNSKGRCMRVLDDRENWYLPPDGAGDQCGVYLKKHHVRTWSTRVRATLSVGPGVTAARLEAENARSLSALGIDVMQLVAYGEKLGADGMLESFLLTEELAGYAELQDFLRRRFPPRSQRGTRRDPDLRRILDQLARIARQFHGAGYNHRDFYCCHFFVKELASGRFDIRLIDLQRVQRRNWFRRRWIVKDLAQLAYSAPREIIGCKEKIAVLRRYLGVPKLRPADKRLIAAVAGKVRGMERRLGVAP